MDKIFNALYLIFFFGGLFISWRFLLDIDIPKIFKQGKVGSIRAFYIVISIIISGLLALSLLELIKNFYYILS